MGFWSLICQNVLVQALAMKYNEINGYWSNGDACHKMQVVFALVHVSIHALFLQIIAIPNLHQIGCSKTAGVEKFMPLTNYVILKHVRFQNMIETCQIFMHGLSQYHSLYE